MKKRVYAVYDLVALMISSSVLMVEAHDAVAVRSFHDALGSDRTGFSAHPGDFNLVCLGTIDASGVIVPELGLEGQPCPRVVATGESWLAARDGAK